MTMSKTIIAMVICITAALSPAYASDIVILQNKNGNSVTILADADAADRMAKLSREGISNPAVLMPLIKCIVKNGTRAMLDGGPAKTSFVSAFPVTIIDGEESGCRGIAPRAAMDTADGSKFPYVERWYLK
jgi:hypothetical protein